MKRAKFSSVPYALPPRTRIVTTYWPASSRLPARETQKFRFCGRRLSYAPTSSRRRHQLITTLMQSDRFAEATQICEESLAILPDSAELHFYRSDLHLRSNEKSLAIASCKRALALDPVMVAAQQSLSRILLDTEQFEEAEASYRREIELTPEHFGPYHQLGGGARSNEAIHRGNRAIQAGDIAESPLGRIVLQPWLYLYRVRRRLGRRPCACTGELRKGSLKLSRQCLAFIAA